MSEQQIGNITIEHNHGVIVLKDAVWRDGEVTGIVVSGGHTSRLMGATRFTPEPVGSEYSRDVGELSRIRCLGGDMAYVSVVFC